MKGHIRERSPGHWALVIDRRDPNTGRRRRKWVSFEAKGKREAEKEKVRILAEMGAEDYVEPNKLTVAEHVRARVAQWQASGVISAKTAERYNELVENQIVPHIGGKLVQKLKTLDIEAWHTALRTGGRKDGKGGISNRTINHAHRVLSKALKEAARHDLVKKNVASEEGAPKVDGEEMVILTEEQLRSLPALLAGQKIYPVAIVAVYTGMRRGEMLALRWSNVDLDAKVIRIRESLEKTKTHGFRFKSTKTKSGRRDITLPDFVVDTLRDHRKAQLELRVALGAGRPEADALVFPASPEGEPIDPPALSAGWGQTAERRGLKGIGFHALRHTHASQLIDAGIDVVTISKRLGRPGIYRQRRIDGRGGLAVGSVAVG